MLGPDPERDAYLTWTALGERIAESDRTPEGRAAGEWAVDVLAPLLGDAWLRGTQLEGSSPQEILYADFHALAFGDLLELALRLYLLADVGGMGVVRRELRSDMRIERRTHTKVLLGAAGLALRKGWPVALEAHLGPGLPPTDLAVDVSSDTKLVAEVFVVFTDELMRAGMSSTDDLMVRVRAICFGHGVELDGHFDGGASEESDAWFAEVEMAAEIAERDGRVVSVDSPAGRVDVVPMNAIPKRSSLSFTGPQMSGKGGGRLARIVRHKARQAVSAGGGWVRADVLDGLWQFTEWASLPLAEKGEALASEVRSALADVDGIRGAVVSTGAAMAQGLFHGESARIANGGFVLRRPFSPLRVRETIIIPVDPAAAAEAQAWCSLYNDEDQWLDWALNQVGLGPAARVLGLVGG